MRKVIATVYLISALFLFSATSAWSTEFDKGLEAYDRQITQLTYVNGNLLPRKGMLSPNPIWARCMPREQEFRRITRLLIGSFHLLRNRVMPLPNTIWV